jgi:hypothetical protein
MNKEPKSMWKKSWTGWRGLLFGWLILMATLAVIFSIWLISMGAPIAKSGDELLVFGIFAISITTIFLLATFIRWLCCRRNFKRLLFGLACLATLIALAYAEEDWRGWHAWNQFKLEWEAKGEKFDFASVVPPPVPDDQNFALSPVVASCYAAWFDKNGNRVKPYDTNVVDRLDFDLGDTSLKTNGLGNWAKGTFSNLKPRQVFYRELGKTNLFPVPPQPQSPAADVLLALSKYDATVEELRQASQLPQSRFPLDYGTECPADIVLPHLAAMKSSIQLLQLRSLAEEQNGQSDTALADLRLMLRLTEAMRQEPFLISHLVRIAMLQITLQPIYEGLAEHRWSDAQLIALDAELAKLNFLADFKLSMRGEMGLQSGIIDYLRRHPEQIPNVLGMFGGETEPQDFHPPLPVKILTHLIPSGWLDQNRLRLVRITVEFYLPTADEVQRTASPAGVRRAEEAFRDETKKGTTPYNVFERVMLSALGAAVKQFAYTQATVDLARTAIALERYRLAHGEYPESLDALAPQFIEKVPHDVIGGGPLHYRRTDDGQFILYSVGWNKRDDGGVVVFNKDSTQVVNRDEGDWVWRYPAK